MIANFFTKSNLLNTIVIIGIFLINYYFSVYNEIVPFNWLTLPLFGFLFALSSFVNHKNNLTFDNLFSLLFLIILIGFFPQVIVVNKIFIANLFILFFLRKVYSLVKEKNTFKKVFDASLWLGISFLIEPFTIVFILLLFSAIFIYNKLNISTIILTILGFLTPSILYFTYCFWFNKIDDFTELFYWYSEYDYSLYKNTSIIYEICFSSFFIVAAIFLKSSQLTTKITSFRINWILIIINFLLSLFLVIITHSKNGNQLIYLFFPASLILANGLEVYQKNKIVDGILILFFINLLIPFLNL